jgi:Fe-S-cluster containining protein
VSDLCLHCGLCCDGSLFGRVPLEPGEAERLADRPVDFAPHGRALEQPCRALGPHGCAIYDERPAACRRFTCRLLARGGPLEPRQAVVRHARELLADEARSPEDLALLQHLLEHDFGRSD